MQNLSIMMLGAFFRAVRFADAIKPQGNARNYILLITFWVLGVAIGEAAWHTSAGIRVVLLLPFLWMMASGAQGAGLLMFGYYLAGLSDVPHVYESFFQHETIVGYWVLSIQAALLAAPYAWLKRYGALGFAGAILITAFPPLGLIGGVSPLLIAGELFPGSGIAGLIIAIALFTLIAHFPKGGEFKRDKAFMALTMLSYLFFYWINVYCTRTYQEPDKPLTWYGMNTTYGKYNPKSPEAPERIAEVMHGANEAIKQGAKLILLPEEIVGEWDSFSEYMWAHTIAHAKENDATLLIGAARRHGDQWKNVLVIRGADTGEYSARLPIPIGEWRPFVPGWYDADLWKSGVINVKGNKTAVSVCYEDYLVWPLVQSIIMDRPSVVISTANNWFATNADYKLIQEKSISLMARLFGLPLVRALNG